MESRINGKFYCLRKKKRILLISVSFQALKILDISKLFGFFLHSMIIEIILLFNVEKVSHHIGPSSRNYNRKKMFTH